MRVRTVAWVGVMCAFWAGCGSDDDNKKSTSGGSFASIADSVAHPTGKLAAANATSVADEYAKINAGSAGGMRHAQAASQTQEQACPAGGKYVVTASGTEAGGQATLDYQNCCYSSASCCLNGDGMWYFASAAGSAYNYCGSYNITFTCEGSSGTAKYSGCVGADGEWVYVVTVGGKTFAVSGSYHAGSGTLEITDASGKFTCTYTDGSGSCTGSSGSFDF